MPNQDLALNDVFHALSDPTRRAVLQRLGEGPASVKDLSEPFDMALPSFTQHLRVLEEGGLIKSKKVGRVRICEIKPKQLSKAERWFEDQRALWEGRLGRLDAYIEDLQKKGT